jgi:hypothetical protein
MCVWWFCIVYTLGFCIVYTLVVLYCLYFGGFVLFILWWFCIVYTLVVLYCLYANNMLLCGNSSVTSLLEVVLHVLLEVEVSKL